jgi:hypothetical protein
MTMALNVNPQPSALLSRFVQVNGGLQVGALHWTEHSTLCAASALFMDRWTDQSLGHVLAGFAVVVFWIALALARMRFRC